LTATLPPPQQFLVEGIEGALYDLEADPYELDNLIGSMNHREVRSMLREQLITKIKGRMLK
jgi:hypothetical protein